MPRVKDEGSQLLILSDPNIMTCKLTELKVYKTYTSLDRLKEYIDGARDNCHYLLILK